MRRILLPLPPAIWLAAAILRSAESSKAVRTAADGPLSSPAWTPNVRSLEPILGDLDSKHRMLGLQATRVWIGATATWTPSAGDWDSKRRLLGPQAPDA